MTVTGFFEFSDFRAFCFPLFDASIQSFLWEMGVNLISEMMIACLA